MGRKIFDLVTMGIGYLPSKLFYKVEKWNVYRFVNDAFDLVEEIMNDPEQFEEKFEEVIDLLWKSFQELKEFDEKHSISDRLRRLTPSTKMFEKMFGCMMSKRQFKMDKVADIKGINNTIPTEALQSRDTLKAYMMEMREKFDVNNDGVIDDEEMNQVLDQHKKEMSKQKDILMTKTAKLRAAIRMLGGDADGDIEMIIDHFDKYIAEKVKDVAVRQNYIKNTQKQMKMRRGKKIKNRSNITM